MEKNIIKKALALFLVVSVTIGITGCSNSGGSTVADYKVDSDLPKQESINYEYLANNTLYNKDFKTDANYNSIIAVVDNFLNSTTTINYSTANATTLSKFYDYCSESLKAVNSSSQIQTDLKNTKGKKIQSKYCKTNLNEVIYNSYSNSYFVDCTCYVFIQNSPDVATQNKYYQYKRYFNIINENNKWVVDNFNGYSSIRAEESKSIYMLDISKTNSVYLQKSNINKLTDLTSVQNTLAEFLKTFYTTDYKNTSNYENNLVKYGSFTGKSYLSELASNLVQSDKSTQLQGKFLSVDYNYIDFSSYDNSYWITVIPKWNITHQDGAATNTTLICYETIHLINQNDQWKIEKIQQDSDNLLISGK